MAACGEPLRVGGGVVGDEAGVEAHRLRRGRALHDRGARYELVGTFDAIGGQAEAELHGLHATRNGPHRGGGRSVVQGWTR